MTQNMDSRKNMVQVLPIACGSVGTQSLLLVTALAGLKKESLLIRLVPFRVIIVLKHFECL